MIRTSTVLVFLPFGVGDMLFSDHLVHGTGTTPISTIGMSVHLNQDCLRFVDS